MVASQKKILQKQKSFLQDDVYYNRVNMCGAFTMRLSARSADKHEARSIIVFTQINCSFFANYSFMLILFWSRI